MTKTPNKMKAVVGLAETWDSPSTQDNLTRGQVRAIGKMASDLVTAWADVGIELSVDGLYLFLAGITVQEQISDPNDVTALVTKLMGAREAPGSSSVMLKLVVARLAHQLLNGEIEVKP